MYPLDELAQPLRNIAESSFDSDLGVVITDQRFVVQWCNRRWSDLTAIEAHEAVGQELGSLRATAPTPAPQRLAHRPVAYPDPFGGLIELRSLAMPIFDGSECVGYANVEATGAASDSEELNRLRTGLQSTESMLRESQQLYRELFANSADLIQSTDLDGRVLFVNDAWLHRLGYREPDTAGVHISEVLAPEYADELDIFHCRRPETQHRLRVELVTRDGGRVWVEGSVSYRFVGERAVGTHAILRDISEAVRLQELEAEFISMVNHELRTPLTSIAGAIELLLSGVAGDLPEKANKYLDIARRNADRLHNIIGDMIEMERLSVDSMEVNLHELSVESIVRAAVEDNRGYATREDVALEWSADDLTVSTDGSRIHQLLSNLISNAINHGRPGEVHVSATCGRGVCRLAVADDGRGIPLGFRPHMFERFRQGASSGHGSGLGLSIVKALGDRLGGEIGWCSVEGTGSVFWIDFPIDRDCGDRRGITATSGVELLWGLGLDPAAVWELTKTPDDALLEQLASSGWPAPLRLLSAPAEVERRFAGEFEFL